MAAAEKCRQRRASARASAAPTFCLRQSERHFPCAPVEFFHLLQVDGVYVEPYAGGAAVAMELLLHEYVRKIYINDISAGVAAFWRSVLDNTDALCAAIAGAKLDMEEWHRQRHIHREGAAHDDLALGFSTFYLNRTNRSGILSAGVSGGKSQAGKWKLNARFNAVDLIQRIHAIARVRGRIDFRQLDALDFLDEVLPALPAKNLIYLDPPTT